MTIDFENMHDTIPKKFENLPAAIALHFAHYNLVRLHKTLATLRALSWLAIALQLVWPAP